MQHAYTDPGPGAVIRGSFGVCASEHGSCFTVEPRGKITMIDMTVRDSSRTAVNAGYVRMDRRVVSGTLSGSAVNAVRGARISTSTIENKAFFGITGTRIRIEGSTIRDNEGHGLSIDNGSKLVDTAVTGNGGVGINVKQGRIRLFGGAVSGNCVVSPEPADCADLATCRLSAKDVSCGASVCRGLCFASDCSAGQPFGVCSGD